MKTMKKKTLPTYTVLIRTPAGTQTILLRPTTLQKPDGHMPSTRAHAACALTGGS